MSGSSGASPVVTTLTVDDTNLRTALANAATLINGYTRANEAAARALAQHGTGSDTAAGGVRNLGSYVGQAGLQLQDFAVQVQAGTSAITALSQQGSQFLGAFGTGGAMAGAVLTVGILVSQFLRTEDATEAAKRAADSYATAVERLRDLMESAAEKAERLRQNSIAAGVAAARALGETATRRGEDLGEQILRADGDLQRMEAQRAQMRGANSAGLAARRLDANIEAARRRVESLRGDANIAGAEVRGCYRSSGKARAARARANRPNRARLPAAPRGRRKNSAPACVSSLSPSRRRPRSSAAWSKPSTLPSPPSTAPMSGCACWRTPSTPAASAPAASTSCWTRPMQRCGAISLVRARPPTT